MNIKIIAWHINFIMKIKRLFTLQITSKTLMNRITIIKNPRSTGINLRINRIFIRKKLKKDAAAGKKA